MKNGPTTESSSSRPNCSGSTDDHLCDTDENRIEKIQEAGTKTEH